MTCANIYPVISGFPRLALEFNGRSLMRVQGGPGSAVYRGKWWRGLDSNQRTLARADLQSAAFNHSATSPGRHPVTWAGAPHGEPLCACQRAPRKGGAGVCPLLAPLVHPRIGWAGAGEGNRTLVVSLEGFCSTIELHPLGRTPMGAMPFWGKPRQQTDRIMAHTERVF
jgi:hypothetical protein